MTPGGVRIFVCTAPVDLRRVSTPPVCGSALVSPGPMRASSCVVVAITYKKFVRKDRERGGATEVLTATALELPIERALAGPSRLADIIVRRWQDHQPLTRLKDICERACEPAHSR